MKILLISTLIFFIDNSLLGQSLDQINKAKKSIKMQGLNESEARSLAKQQGYSEVEINEALAKNKNDIKSITSKEQNKGNDILEEKSNNQEITDVSDTDEKDSPQIKDEKFLDNLEIINDSDLDSGNDENIQIEKKSSKQVNSNLKYFGYDIFSKDPKIFQATTFGAVDPSYLIGPGDEIIVMLWGETQFRQELIVDREGFINN